MNNSSFSLSYIRQLQDRKYLISYRSSIQIDIEENKALIVKSENELQTMDAKLRKGW